MINVIKNRKIKAMMVIGCPCEIIQIHEFNPPKCNVLAIINCASWIRSGCPYKYYFMHNLKVINQQYMCENKFNIYSMFVQFVTFVWYSLLTPTSSLIHPLFGYQYFVISLIGDYFYYWHNKWFILLIQGYSNKDVILLFCSCPNSCRSSLEVAGPQNRTKKWRRNVTQLLCGLQSGSFLIMQLFFSYIWK